MRDAPPGGTDSQPGGPPAYPPAPPPPYPGYGHQPVYYQPVQPGNGVGVAAGVLGIVAVVLAVVPFIDFAAVVLGVLAIVFGAIGNGRAATLGGAGRGMAITGIVCGSVALLISIFFIAAIYTSVVFH